MSTNPLMAEWNQMRNPAYTSFLSWQMACGYEEAKHPASFMPIGLLFVGVPLLLNGLVRGVAASTQLRTGIEGFVRNLNDCAPDLRGSLFSQMQDSRGICCQGLATGCRYGLLSIEHGKLIALRKADLTVKDQRVLGGTITQDARAARKLGSWFAMVGPRELELLFNMEF
ncbi:MAG TPA: DUF6521 family protein [Kiritimatiellia bacterium]|nr:DUF6521 family protein [Kiritimatiellia bacterium]HMP00399.1 DUF6521 family protein [Kiritimatiellia bacterium]